MLCYVLLPFVLIFLKLIKENMSEAIPQYMKIRQYVFGLIANAKVVGGTLKINTEEELCKIFGVSRITVRKALTHLVDEGLLVRMPSLGTFIRPEIVDRYSMRFEKKLAIGLIYADGMATFMEEFFMAQVEKVLECLRANNCIARLIYFNGDPEREAELLSKGKLDGIIWLAPDRKHIPVLRIFKSCHVPVVATFPIFISDEFDSVAMDYYKCGYTVAKYLLGRGHREILYINRNPSDVEAVKKAGCMAAFADCGAEWHERLWHCCSGEGFSEARVKSILENSGNFTAVNCHGIHVNHVKHELANRKDVQIIYNIYSESAAEGIPGILQPVAQAAGQAAAMLLDLIKQPDTSAGPRQLLLETKIFEPER
jgi:DNA-binding LacI/PurR family transcriptional regulator